MRNTKAGKEQREGLCILEAVQLAHPAVLTVAGMNTERKGIAELLEAFSLLADQNAAVQLYLVGGGCELKSFQAKDLGHSMAGYCIQCGKLWVVV